MPNITISGLPPAILPLDDPNTLFEVTVLEAGEEVSRKITLADIATSTGLDASFLTLSANAQLPNERVLTEGANVTFVDTGPNGTLTISVSGGAFGNVFKVGTPVDNQIGVWTGDGTIEGDPNFTWDGSQLLLPLENVPGAPTIGFGDGDSGFFQPLDDNLQLSLVGTVRFFWELDSYNALAGTGPAMVNAAGGATVPGFVPRRSDPNTGIGSAGNDILSLIAGGVSIAQATSVGNNQFAIAQSGSSSVPDLTSLADADTGFRWTGSNQVVWIGGGTRAWNFSTARFFSQFSNGPSLENLVATDTVPSVLPDQGDSNTGIGHPAGSDELSLIAGGVEAIRIDETAAVITILTRGTVVGQGGFRVDQANGGFLVDENATGTNPTLLPSQSDLDTGIGWAGLAPSDSISIIAGGVAGLQLTEASSRIIQTNANHVGLTASVTQTQAGGLALLSSYNEIATVANSGDALTAFGVKEGDRLTVINNGADSLQLFPAVGDDLGVGVDAPISIASGDTAVFIGRDATNWDLLQNSSVSGGAFAGLGTWRYRTEITSPPADGQIRFNNADPTLATELFMAETNVGGTDVGNFLDLLTAGSLLYIQNRSDGDNFFVVEISTNVDSGTFRTFGIADIVLQGAEPSNNTQMTIVAVESGAGGAAGTVTNSILRFDGADFVETTQYRATLGATGFQIFDSGLADNVSIGHDGSIGLINTVGSTEVVFGLTSGPSLAWRYEQMVRVPDGSAAVPGITWFGDIATGIFRQALGLSISITGVEQARFSNATTQIFSDDFRLQPNIGADLARFIVNGPSNLNDFEIELTSLIDFHVSGSTGERFVLEEFNLAMVEKSAAPADVATVGQFWVRDDVPNTPMFTDDAGTDFVLNAAAVSFPEFQFGPDILLNPNSADWTVNALAPAVADSNNAGLTVRLFDDTTEEGVGFQFEVPAGATNIIFTFRSRAETAPGIANTVGLDIYNRGIPDNAAVQAWSAATQLTDIDIPTNEFFQEDSQTVTLATLGLTAGELTQFELVRTAPTGGTDLTGDWVLGNIKVSFS